MQSKISTLPQEKNYDSDADHVPDFAERVHNCLEFANTRYNAYYQPTLAQRNELSWMKLDYWIGTVKHARYVYPIFLQREPATGWVEPWIFRVPDVDKRTGKPSNGDSPVSDALKTYMNLDSRGQLSTRESDWLYPHLENTVYHEMFHTYQGIYKALNNPWDWNDNWIYEGTAVFAADQALLPQCANALSVRCSAECCW